jgi:acetyl esterase/lipase
MTSSLLGAQPAPGGPRVADLQLRGRAGSLRTSVRWPPVAGGPVPPPLLVLLPAAGTDDVWTTVSALAGVVVLAVTDTRLTRLADAAALVEATTATEWAADHAAELDADPRRLIVAGEGRGAWLAAAVALQARDDGWPTLARQVLVVPTAPGRRAGQGAARLVSPRRAPSLAGVAPAIVLTVGDGPHEVNVRRYVSRLHGAGVGVDDLRHHGPAEDIAPCLASTLRRALGGGGGRPA